MAEKKRSPWTLARPSSLTEAEFAERKRISKHLAIPFFLVSVLLLVVVVIVVAVVPGDEKEPAGASPAASQAPAAEPSAPTADAEEEAKDTGSVDAGRTARLQEEMELSWGGAGNPDLAVSWWSLVEKIEVAGSSLDVETAIYPDGEGREIAKQVCNVLNGNYVLANTADYSLETVTVYGQGRDPLAWTSGFSGHC